MHTQTHENRKFMSPPGRCTCRGRFRRRASYSIRLVSAAHTSWRQHGTARTALRHQLPPPQPCKGITVSATKRHMCPARRHHTHAHGTTCAIYVHQAAARRTGCLPQLCLRGRNRVRPRHMRTVMHAFAQQQGHKDGVRPTPQPTHPAPPDPSRAASTRAMTLPRAPHTLCSRAHRCCCITRTRLRHSCRTSRRKLARLVHRLPRPHGSNRAPAARTHACSTAQAMYLALLVLLRLHMWLGRRQVQVPDTWCTTVVTICTHVHNTTGVRAAALPQNTYSSPELCP